jgi:hypothetical protein
MRYITKVAGVLAIGGLVAVGPSLWNLLGQKEPAVGRQ